MMASHVCCMMAHASWLTNHVVAESPCSSSSTTGCGSTLLSINHPQTGRQSQKGTIWREPFEQRPLRESYRITSRRLRASQ